MLLPVASLLIFIGTSTPKDGASQGIYAVRLDPATGALSDPVVAAATPNPTFLAWHPDHRVLYALGEGPGPDGKSGGGVAAFAFNPPSDKLTLLNARGTGGGGNTSMLATDATGRMLITVSYGAGYVASFPLVADGRIGPRAALIAHTGPPGPDKSRQDKPHPHSVTISPDNRFAFIADLGLDRVLAYRLEPLTGALTPHVPAFITTPPGTGPRHTKFSRDGRYFYILNELIGSVTVCAFDPALGTGTPTQQISTLPAGYTGQNISAEIRLHPNGKFVYASNRGHDSIAVFAVNADGTLRLVELTPSGGQHPRNFELSPDGVWLVCANRDSDNLVSFKIDATTGRLTPTGSVVTVPQAVCVLFAPAGN